MFCLRSVLAVSFSNTDDSWFGILLRNALTFIHWSKCPNTFRGHCIKITTHNAAKYIKTLHLLLPSEQQGWHNVCLLPAGSFLPHALWLWQWPSCPGPVLPLATLTRICSGVALILDRWTWPFLSAGQLCQDLCPTQTHQPHQPVHMAIPPCLFLGQSLMHKGWRKRSPLLPEPSPGHHNASPNDVFITPPVPWGCSKALF